MYSNRGTCGRQFTFKPFTFAIWTSTGLFLWFQKMNTLMGNGGNPSAHHLVGNSLSGILCPVYKGQLSYSIRVLLQDFKKSLITRYAFIMIASLKCYEVPGHSRTRTYTVTCMFTSWGLSICSNALRGHAHQQYCTITLFGGLFTYASYRSRSELDLTLIFKKPTLPFPQYIALYLQRLFTEMKSCKWAHPIFSLKNNN